ncbi:HPr kinase/phosphorylase, partial [Nitrospinota bacterium]
MTQLSIAQFFENLRENLRLEVLAGREGFTRKIRDTRFQKNGLALAGFLETVYPDRIQIWGNTELSYLASLDEIAQIETVSRFFRLPICAV